MHRDRHIIKVRTSPSLVHSKSKKSSSSLTMDPVQVRERFPGVTVTLDRTDTRALSKLVRSNTEPTISSIPTEDSYVPRLPPAVATVPREDSKGYVHSKKVNNYLIGATLGEGSFAKVKESFHVLVGEKVAMKIIDKKKALQDPYVAKNFKREARLLQKLRHPNIMQLYEVIETDNNYYLITELCSGGELMKYIYKHGRLSEEESRKYMRQLVSAVDHLHRAGLIHRDLKVENMLLDGNMDLKLIDFGLSNEEFVVDESGIEKHCRTQCGSPAYAAPELLGQKQYNNSVDIWSIGVNMYAMLTGQLPFTVEPFNITTLHAKMLQNKMNPLPDNLSENCKDLLKRLLTASPDNRITMPEIFNHPWLNEGRTLPFQPAPYPNTLTNSHIDSDIIDHMTNGLRLGPALEMKHDLITNRATSHYAVYHLLASRLARYRREFPSKTSRQQKTITTPKKKVSKDLGFYDADDDVEVSSVASVPVRTTTRGGTRKSSGDVVLRQNPRRGNPRPLSDQLPEAVPTYHRNRRLSDIIEERRASMPSDLMKKDIEYVRQRMLSKKQTQVHKPPESLKKALPSTSSRHSHPQPNYPLPHAHINHTPHITDMSPPLSDPYEFDIGHHLDAGLLKPTPNKIHSLHRDLPRYGTPLKTAWNSNPPSRSSSKASFYGKLPSLHSSLSIDSEEEVEFHDISNTSPTSPTGQTTFFIESPSPTPRTPTPTQLSHPQTNHTTQLPCPLNSPLPAISTPTNSSNSKKRGTSLKRRNGVVIPPSGDITLKTDISISAIIGELLRVAQNMKMKTAEPSSGTKVHFEHKSVSFDVSIRRKSITSCIIHFEWLSGGSLKQFNEVCSSIVTNIKT